jgi:hypothetical protein
MRISVAATLALLVAACPASAKELIACRFPAGPDVMVRLDDRKVSGQTLNCIEGSFTHGVTSCAPNNAFGFLPNGSDQPLQIVGRWENHIDQDGSVVGYTVTSDSIGFEGFPLFFGRRDDNRSWKFVIDLRSATAQLTEGNNFHPPLTFNCARVNAKSKIQSSP